jgi:hypothetical protein
LFQCVFLELLVFHQASNLSGVLNDQVPQLLPSTQSRIPILLYVEGRSCGLFWGTTVPGGTKEKYEKPLSIVSKQFPVWSNYMMVRP